MIIPRDPSVLALAAAGAMLHHIEIGEALEIADILLAPMTDAMSWRQQLRDFEHEVAVRRANANRPRSKPVEPPPSITPQATGFVLSDPRPMPRLVTENDDE